MGILTEIQFRLNAPKNQYNSFGKYKFRSCEDILEGLKPLLKEFNCVVTFDDDIIQVGNRIYVKSTAYLKEYYTPEGKNAEIETLRIIDKSSAFAREPEKQTGMQDGQLTGSTSTYARKYSLNGLFAIDDAKDADTDEHHNNASNRPKQNKQQQKKQDPKALFDNTSDKIVRQYLGSGKLLDSQRDALIKDLDSGKKVACQYLVDELIKEYGSLNA